jgi:hypothetical protein
MIIRLDSLPVDTSTLPADAIVLLPRPTPSGWFWWPGCPNDHQHHTSEPCDCSVRPDVYPSLECEFCTKSEYVGGATLAAFEDEWVALHARCGERADAEHAAAVADLISRIHLAQSGLPADYDPTAPDAEPPCPF